MSISGTLDNFSIPEIFQIIESGNKTGMLEFKFSSNKMKSNSSGTFELWFQQGNFVSIVNSLNYQFLIDQIINQGWVSRIDTIQIIRLCPENKPLGTYLKELKIISESQLELLFKIQINKVVELFNIDRGWFKFEDVNNNNIIPSQEITFPWHEMTGNQKQATQLSLEAMRNFSNWSRYMNEMPLPNCGLQRLVKSCSLEFDTLEKFLCNTADGSTSLRKIANKMDISIEKVQRTALSMILAGLLEEVPLVNSNINVSSNQVLDVRSSLAEKKPISVKTKRKSKVSNSLINNLTNFLKNKF